MLWKTLLGLALIGSAYLVAISGKTALAPPEKVVELINPTEARALIKASLPPEIANLPDLMLREENAEPFRMSFAVCVMHGSQDGSRSCDDVAQFDIRTETGQVCMRIPGRGSLMREVQNPRVAALQEAIRKRLGLSMAEYEKQKVECS